jgi:mono/diheme cytochrome c family protein
MGFLGSALGVMIALAATTGAQDKRAAVEMSGPALFKSYCSSCHGADAKGEGPIAHALRFQPSDLTQIARRSEGKFDKEKVHRMIDGRDPVRGHGGPDMPLWGDAFRRSGEGFSDDAVKVRIDSLVSFIETLQVK